MYTPLGGSLALSAVAAAIPLVVLFLMIGALRRPAWQAALAALARLGYTEGTATPPPAPDTVATEEAAAASDAAAADDPAQKRKAIVMRAPAGALLRFDTPPDFAQLSVGAVLFSKSGNR